MARGPKPKRQRILNGNAGKRPIPDDDDEVQATKGIPIPPEHLVDIARAEWARVVVELKHSQILATADRGILARYCAAWSIWVRATADVDERGLLITSIKGVQYGNPSLFIATKTMGQLHRFGAALGLDPASRTKLKIAGGKEELDPFEAYLASAPPGHRSRRKNA